MNIYLGKNIDGRVVNADLRDIKHLLIVGKTGAGKTDFIGAIIRDFISKNKSDAIKFCLFSDCWFLLKDEISPEYLLYGAEKSIAKSEDEANDLLDCILTDMSVRLGKLTQNVSDFPESENMPEIVLLFDNNAFYFRTEINEKINKIIGCGNNIGVHVVFSLQQISKKDETSIAVFPSVLCGKLSSEKEYKKLHVMKITEMSGEFWFALKSPVFSENVRCDI